MQVISLYALNIKYYSCITSEAFVYQGQLSLAYYGVMKITKETFRHGRQKSGIDPLSCLHFPDRLLKSLKEFSYCHMAFYCINGIYIYIYILTARFPTQCP